MTTLVGRGLLWRSTLRVLIGWWEPYCTDEKVSEMVAYWRDTLASDSEEQAEEAVALFAWSVEQTKT